MGNWIGLLVQRRVVPLPDSALTQSPNPITRLPDYPITGLPASPRILLIRLRQIGDVVFTTPAIRALRERFPDLVPEAPPAGFERPMKGRLPLVRIGWAVIRPQPGGRTAGGR